MVAMQMNAIFLLNTYCETKGKVSILDELNMAKKSQAKHTSGLRETRAAADEERKHIWCRIQLNGMSAVCWLANYPRTRNEMMARH